MSGVRAPVRQSHPIGDLDPIGSTMFDLEMEEAFGPQDCNASLQHHLITMQRTLAPLLHASAIGEMRLTRDVRWLNYTTVKEDGRRDAVVLASKLVNIGYKVALRTAMGGGAGQDCFHNLHHEFLIIAQHDQEVIVDCHFKDQFKIGQHTQQYQQVLHCLPEVFVGPAVRLAHLVELLCSEMAIAFKEGGATCPPWRQPKSMISKWLPTKAHDIYIGRDHSTSSHGSSASVSSDDELWQLADAGLSPTGPLPSYHDNEVGLRQWSKAGSQPLITLTGFRVKSLLSSGLAALNSKKSNQSQDVWKQPVIRTVRMTGRPLMQAQAV